MTLARPLTRILLIGSLFTLALTQTAAGDNDEQPTAGPVQVTAKSVDHATVQATLDSGDENASYWFEYARTSSPSTSRTSTGSLRKDRTQTVAAQLNGLAAGTEYRVRLYATNEEGSAQGDWATFTTMSPPAAAPTPDPTGQPAPDPAAPASAPETDLAEAPAPELGEEVVVAPAAGTVRVKAPGADGYATLTAGDAIPVGSRLDTRKGAVALTSALPGGKVQTGTFRGGLFDVRQSATGDGMTDLHLRGRLERCGSARALASAAAKKKKSGRRLWGSDKNGKFRTHGRDSVATVRGTRWLTEDRCTGTLTRVYEGAVSVRDTRRGKTVVVRAGGRYLARHR